MESGKLIRVYENYDIIRLLKIYPPRCLNICGL